MNEFREMSSIEKSIAVWQVEDGLLQQYRSISLSVQSFIVVVAALIAEKFSCHPNLQRIFIFIFALGLFHIFRIWYPIVRYRGKIVHYHKQIIFGNYSREQLFHISIIASAEEYAGNFYKWLDLVHKYPKFREDIGLTRMRLDFYVPAIYILIWFCLLYYVVGSEMSCTG